MRNEESEITCEACGTTYAAGAMAGMCPACLLSEVAGDESPTGNSSLDLRGTRIDRYLLQDPLGEGGMGTVWRAIQDEPIEREVALKLIKPGMDTRAVIERFEAERKVLTNLNHPNIASVLDAGVTKQGRPYFVMELVEGISITSHCQRQDLDLKARLHLFVDVCRAVAHAHEKGVIHRDLKPGNILVSSGSEGTGPRVKVIDFGVAKATTDSMGNDQTLLTLAGQIVGTPGYMSPEQAAADPADVRSDVYSLGVLLYELLTGHPPFESDRLHRAALAEVQRIICEEDPPKPSTRMRGPGNGDESGVRDLDSLRGDLDW
ncbi:MAG: serine/threonine-protein kinase, partial [Verrucomicrobiota bacterium]